MVRILDKSTLIQVNVIIITGLLILLSLQSLSASIYEGVVTDSLQRMADSGIEYNTVHNLYNEYCSNQSNQSFKYLDSNDVNEFCKNLETRTIEVDKQGDVLYKYLESFSILKDNSVTSNAWITMWGSYYAKIISVIVMIPFIISTLIETRNKSTNGEPSNGATSSGLNWFRIGMVILLIGILLILAMVYFTAPWQSFPFHKQPE